MRAHSNGHNSARLCHVSVFLFDRTQFDIPALVIMLPRAVYCHFDWCPHLPVKKSRGKPKQKHINYADVFAAFFVVIIVAAAIIAVAIVFIMTES